MKDIPMFTTEHGFASLILKEIPYRQEAYVRILEAQPGELDALTDECVSFCRMVGAEKVYAAGHEGLAHYPLYTTVLEMKGEARVDQERLENLFPVTEATVSQWRCFYNEKMHEVDNGATLEVRDEKRITTSGGAYFVHSNGELLGIGWLDDTKLLAVAAVHGCGYRVMNTLMSLVDGEQVTLEVASTNHRAIRLYEELGFLPVSEISRWYCLYEK